MEEQQLTLMAPKMEIINLLAARNRFSRYLELCTPTTGNHYADLDRSLLSTAHRLMYRCPAEFDDGLAIEFRSENSDIEPCVKEIERRGSRYDIVLVDPWHEYATSKRDLDRALRLTRDGGIVVVHDCLPPSAEIASSQFRPGTWCGVTYKAYVDTVGMRRDLVYCTVDIDYGCGVIRKLGRRSFGQRALGLLSSALRRRRSPWKQWYEIGDDFDRAFECLQQNKVTLLHLVDPSIFFATIDRRP